MNTCQKFGRKRNPKSRNRDFTSWQRCQSRCLSMHRPATTLQTLDLMTLSRHNNKTLFQIHSRRVAYTAPCTQETISVDHHRHRLDLRSILQAWAIPVTQTCSHFDAKGFSDGVDFQRLILHSWLALHVWDEVVRCSGPLALQTISKRTFDHVTARWNRSRWRT